MRETFDIEYWKDDRAFEFILSNKASCLRRFANDKWGISTQLGSNSDHISLWSLGGLKGYPLTYYIDIRLKDSIHKIRKGTDSITDLHKVYLGFLEDFTQP